MSRSRSGVASDGTLTVGFTDSNEAFGQPLCGYDVLTGFGAIDPSEPSVLSILGRATGSCRFQRPPVVVGWGDVQHPIRPVQQLGGCEQVVAFPPQRRRVSAAVNDPAGEPLLPQHQQLRGRSWLRRRAGARRCHHPLLELEDRVRGVSPAGARQRAAQPSWDLREAAHRLQPNPKLGLSLHARHGRSPTGKPQHPDQWFRNEFGDVYPAAGFPRLRDEIVNSAGTLLSLDGNTDDFSNHALYARNAVAGWGQLSPEGAIRWNYDQHTTGLNIFRQRRDGAEYPLRLTWTEWTTFLTDVNPDAAFVRLRDHSRWLGVFSAHADAFDFLDEQITQQEFDTLATDYYYGIESSDTGINADPKGGIYKVTAFSASAPRLRRLGPALAGAAVRPRSVHDVAAQQPRHHRHGVAARRVCSAGPPGSARPRRQHGHVRRRRQEPGRAGRRHHRMGDLRRRRDPNRDLRVHSIQPLGTNYRQIGDIDVPTTGDIEMTARVGQPSSGGNLRIPASWMAGIVGTTAVVFSDSTTATNQIAWECRQPATGHQPYRCWQAADGRPVRQHDVPRHPHHPHHLS